MKTKRKLRQRRLALDFATPANPVDHDRGREMLARIAAKFSKDYCGLSTGIHDNSQS